MEALILIWKDLFKRADIGPDDDFFALGGDCFAAEELFAEIAARFKIRLPSLLICQAPTVASLAALLDRPDAVPIPVLVPLNHGHSGPPVFVGHGLGDTVVALHPFVTKMNLPQPVFGMQIPGAGSLEPPLERIEAIAQWFVSAVRRLQPRGPYFLIGYSLGGLVAFEMARQLAAQGEQIGLLAMLDVYPARRYLNFAARLRLTRQLIVRKLAKLLPAKLNPSKSGSAPGAAMARSNSAVPLAIQQGRVAQRRTLRRYRPTFFPGRVKFVKAATLSHFTDDPAGIWAHLCEGFEIESMPGKHVDMMTQNAEALASIVARWVREAVSRKI